MTPKCKKRSTYILMGLFYLLGGVEYAVILPTVYLYLTTCFNAPSYFLGLMLSAFTFSGLFSNPIMGIVSDKMRNTKVLFLFANLWEIAGNIMYFLGFSAWFLVSSRLVAGVGAGVGSPMTGDITRATTLEERTPVLSILGAMRQIGLLLGPGFNLFLRSFNFYIGSFIVDKYTSPGLFMALLWTLLNVAVLFLYFELPTLKSQERLANEISYPRRIDSTYLSDSIENISINSPLLDDLMRDGQIETGGSVVASPASRMNTYGATLSPPVENIPATRRHRHAKRRPPINMIKDHDMTTSDEMIDSAEVILSSSCPQRAFQERLYHQIMDDTPRAKSAPVDMQSSDSLENSTQLDSRATLGNSLQQQTTGGDSSFCNGEVVSPGDTVPPGGGFENYVSSSRPLHRDRDSIDHVHCNGDVNQFNNDAHPETRVNSGRFHIPWRYMLRVFTREEIIAILAASFIAFFNQVALETMCTPLTERLLGWKELENSIFFCAAGVWILISFLTLRVMSKRFSDRVLLLAGYLMEMTAISWLLYFVPSAKAGDVVHNLPTMMVGVALDLFGLPFIVVTSTSLFSKVTDEDTQGFTQGVKGTVQGVGVLLGPLWAGSLLDTTERLYIMMGVMLGLMVFSLVLLLLSWKHLKERHADILPSLNVQEDEQRPLLAEA